MGTTIVSPVSQIAKPLGFAVADPGGGDQAPLPLLKLVKKKRWPPHDATSFVSHWTPLRQISGSATDSN